MTNQTEPVELLPCPFCGGDAMHEVWSDKHYHHIECSECGVEYDHEHTFADAVKAWNRRTRRVAGRVLTDDELREIQGKHLNVISGRQAQIDSAIKAGRAIEDAVLAKLNKEVE